MNQPVLAPRIAAACRALANDVTAPARRAAGSLPPARPSSLPGLRRLASQTRWWMVVLGVAGTSTLAAAVALSLFSLEQLMQWSLAAGRILVLGCRPFTTLAGTVDWLHDIPGLRAGTAFTLVVTLTYLGLMLRPNKDRETTKALEGWVGVVAFIAGVGFIPSLALAAIGTWWLAPFYAWAALKSAD